MNSWIKFLRKCKHITWKARNRFQKEQMRFFLLEQAQLFAKLITYTLSSLLNSQHDEEDKEFGSPHIGLSGPYILAHTHWSVVWSECWSPACLYILNQNHRWDNGSPENEFGKISNNIFCFSSLFVSLSIFFNFKVWRWPEGKVEAA